MREIKLSRSEILLSMVDQVLLKTKAPVNKKVEMKLLIYLC